MVLDRLFGRRKAEVEVEAEVDSEKAQTISDCNTILEILKNTMGFGSCDFAEVEQKFLRRRVTVGRKEGEERIFKALKVLCDAKLCYWNGTRNDHIGFNKRSLPSSLVSFEV